MIEEKLEITNSFGEKKEILMKSPDLQGKFPGVILVQGIGMDMHERNNSHDEIAANLTKSGFVSIQFNFSYQKYITKDIDKEISLTKRARELETVIDWAVKQPIINKQRLGIYAMSFGVSTILFTNLKKIKSLCLCGGTGFKPKKFAQRYIDKGAIINKNGITYLPRSSGKKLAIDPDFWPAFDNLNQEKLVKKITQPILVIHGDKDSYVSVDDMQKVYNSIPSSTKKLKLFTGGDHGIVDVPPRMRREFLDLVVKWFKETLN